MNKKIWTLNGIAFASLALPAFTIISCGSQENISERMRQINQRFINKIEEETNNFLPESAEAFAAKIKTNFNNYKESINLGTTINSTTVVNGGLKVLINFTHIFGIDSENEKDPNGIRETYKSQYAAKLGKPVTEDALTFFNSNRSEVLDKLDKWKELASTFNFNIVDMESQEFKDFSNQTFSSTAPEKFKLFTTLWNEIFANQQDNKFLDLITSLQDIFKKTNFTKPSQIDLADREKIWTWEKINKAIIKLNEYYDVVAKFFYTSEKRVKFNSFFLTPNKNSTPDLGDFSIRTIFSLNDMPYDKKVSDYCWELLNSNEERK